MLKRYSQVFVTLLVLVDAVIVAAAWHITYLLRLLAVNVAAEHQIAWMIRMLGAVPDNPFGPYTKWYLPVLPAVVLSFLLAYRVVGMYRPRREESIIGELWTITLSSVVGLFVLLAVVFFLAQSGVFSRLIVAVFLIVNVTLTFAARGTIRGILRALRRRGWNRRRILVVGAGKLGQALVNRIQHNTWMGLNVVGYLDDDSARVGKSYFGAPVLGTLDALHDIMAREGVDEIFCALPFEKFPEIQDVLNQLDVATVNVRIVPDLFGFATLRSQIGDFDGLPVVSLRESPLYGWNRVLKRALDLTLGIVLLLLFALPMLIICLVIKLTNKGSPIYRQVRAGLDGSTFRMLKFRTMPVDAEADTGPVWAEERDQRVTRVGRFLRHTSLDELPQIFNIVKGDMSLVGPRPERPVFIEEFKHKIPKYMLRHKMKTGLTGWAQINGWRGNTSLEKRIQYDLYYIENWSIWFDLRILLLTPFKGLISRHAY